MGARSHVSLQAQFPLRQTLVELENLRVALGWSLAERDTNRVLRLGAALRWFWFLHGRLSEGYQWYSEILALPGAPPDTEELGHVISAATLIASRLGKTTDAERLGKRAVALWRRLGNHLETATSLAQLGNVYRDSGQLAEAYRCFEEGVMQSEEWGLRQTEGLNRLGLAETLYDDERNDEALAQAARALDIHEVMRSGPRQRMRLSVGLARIKRAIGLIHYQRGALHVARRFLEESLAEARRDEGRGWWTADALACVAQLDIDGCRLDRAGTLLREALELSMALGDQRMIVRCVERLAYLATAQGQSRRALLLAAAASALRTAAGLPRSPVESKAVERWLGPAEQALESGTREQVRREGATMALERVLTYALEAKPVEEAEPPADSQNQGVLTVGSAR